MNDIAIIDIEASGLHFDSYPIEIAVLKNGEVRSWLIKPEPSWNYWCDTAEHLHGISRETLDKEGRAAAEVVQHLEEYLKDFNGALYSDADQWDADWLSTLYFAAKQTCPFHIASIYGLLSANEAQLFKRSKDKLSNLDRFQHHRAASDVRMLEEAFKLAKNQ